MKHSHIEKDLSPLGGALTFRKARKEDAPDIARFVNQASHGLAWHYWETVAEEGVDPFEVGCQRTGGETGGSSYRNTRLAEIEGQVVAAMITYEIGSEPEEIDREAIPAVFIPLVELENEALNSLYINVLATDTAVQGRGAGTAFLELAGELADGKPLSLICSDANTEAKKLYERVGFKVVATRPMVKGDWNGEGENWLLMIKPAS